MEREVKRDLPALEELKLQLHALQGDEENRLSEFTPTHYKNTLLMRGRDGDGFSRRPAAAVGDAMRAWRVPLHGVGGSAEWK